MKLKRTFSIVIAIIFALSIIPMTALALSEKPEQEPTRVSAAYLNINGCLLTYTDDDYNRPWYICHGEDRDYCESHNAGEANVLCSFRCEDIIAKENDTITFDYWFDTEENWDWFNFTVYKVDSDESTRELHLSGNSNGWQTFTYTFPETATYYCRWEYDKDSSNDVGEDCVRISRVYLSEHWNYQRAEAVTKAGTGLFEYDFSGTYPFYAVIDNDETHPSRLLNGNVNIASSTSQFTISEHTRPATLKFNYAVSCEEQSSSGTYYDYFEVTDNGTSILKVAGNHWSWTSFSYELSQGWHDIQFKYVKDGSVNGNYDRAAVDNIELVYPSSDAAARWQDINYLGSTSKKVYFNTPAGTEGWGHKINSNGSNGRGYSNNRYLTDSESFCETTINMASGETLSFDYVVSSEEWHDKLIFTVNGEDKMTAHGWRDRMWHSYTFTASYTGTYHFKWTYQKDDSVTRGWDYAYIRSVNYNGTYNQGLNLDNLIGSSRSTTDVHFTTDPTYGHGFIPMMYAYGKDASDNWAAMSSNKYMEGTTATLRANAGTIAQGTLITFKYKLSTEAGYDELTFKLMNGSTVVLSDNLGGGEADWSYYQMTVPSSGNFDLVWEYRKDNTQNDGDDCVLITDVSVEEPMPSLDDALNDELTQQTLHFTTSGSYPFEVGKSGSSYYAYSTNQGVASSSSVMTSTATFQAGDSLSFYYLVNSEENYDFFNFYINDQRLVHESGEPGILIYNWTAPSNGTYTLRWEYTKDTSQNVGNDDVRISMVKVIKNGGTPGSGNGDVDGNGTVNVTDAIMALRHAMGVITLNAAQIARGDVDGNGVVNVTDAVRIMRIAMGIG